MVLQDPFLFSGSILENVKYGNSNITLENIKESVKLLGIEEFIDTLSEGLKTIIGQRGSDLSMGQRQLLSILRALLADTQYLILDEATSGLDEETEEKILNNLINIKPKLTIIIITHNKKILKICNKVYKIFDQKIEEIPNT